MQRMYDKDPYAILGIPPAATASQIKQAYHRLARQYHPDLNKDLHAVERMKDINWANSILGNAHERSLYDHWRSSGIRVEFHPRPGSPSQPYHAPPRNPPSSSAGQAQTPRTGYSTNRPAQTSSPTSQSQGCSSSSLLVWIIVIMLMNVGRIFRSTSQPVYYSTPRNIATQTADFVRMNAIIDTFRASQNLGTEDSSFIVLTYLAPQMTSTPTGMEELTDEFGHPDLRPSIVPDSWLWGHINHYFPHLTTPEGLSDEVTLVTYDQLRGYRIQSRSDGDYWLFVNVYDNSIAPAHFTPTAPVSSTPTRIVLRDEYGHEDLRPGIVPGSQEWEWIHQYFPELTTPEGLSDEVTFVYWDQLRRAVMVETRTSGTYFISIYGGNVTAGHYGPEEPTSTAASTPSP